MRTTIDSAGRVVIPRALREQIGLVGPADVEIVVDGAAIRVAPAGTAELVEQDGILVIPATGVTITNDMVLELRDADRRWPRG